MEPEILDDAPVDNYQHAIQLLHLLETDFRLARKTLQDLSLRFSEREALASKQLHLTLHDASKMSMLRKISSVDARQEPLKSRLPQQSAKGTSVSRQYTPTLEAYCFGSFQVRVDWKIIAQWRSTKAKSLLQHMLARLGRPVSKDLLMEALWPGCDPLLGNNNLKAAASALRHTLGSVQDKPEPFSWIFFQDGNYVINPSAHMWCDVDQFEYHWNTGRRLEFEGKIAEAMREFQIAEALYKGDYLEDNLYEEWTILRREALKDIYLVILGRLADYAMKKADYEGCILYSEKMLQKDQCREDVYQRLMVGYSRLGQRSRAMSWYRICERTIKAELDVKPDPETSLLHQKLLNGEHL